MVKNDFILPPELGIMPLRMNHIYHIKHYPKKDPAGLLGLYTGKDHGGSDTLFRFDSIASTVNSYFIKSGRSAFYLHQMLEYKDVGFNDLPLYLYMPFKTRLFEQLITGNYVFSTGTLKYQKITL